MLQKAKKSKLREAGLHEVMVRDFYNSGTPPAIALVPVSEDRVFLRRDGDMFRPLMDTQLMEKNTYGFRTLFELTSEVIRSVWGDENGAIDFDNVRKLEACIISSEGGASLVCYFMGVPVKRRACVRTEALDSFRWVDRVDMRTALAALADCHTAECEAMKRAIKRAHKDRLISWTIQ